MKGRKSIFQIFIEVGPPMHSPFSPIPSNQPTHLSLPIPFSPMFPTGKC